MTFNSAKNIRSQCTDDIFQQDYGSTSPPMAVSDHVEGGLEHSFFGNIEPKKSRGVDQPNSVLITTVGNIESEQTTALRKDRENLPGSHGQRPGRLLSSQLQRIKAMTDEIMPVNSSKSYIMPERSEGSTHQVGCTDQGATPGTNKPVLSLYTTKKSLPIGEVTLPPKPENICSDCL